MELIVVRHAIAEERNSVRWPDDRDRPLTRAGTRRFQGVARAASRVIGEVDLLLASPLLRARQTAAILVREAGWPAAQELAALDPAQSPALVIDHLAERAELERVALVGHEPHLHELLSLLLGGRRAALKVEMKKGGIAWLGLSTPITAGGATLWAVLPPRVLLGEKNRRGE